MVCFVYCVRGRSWCGYNRTFTDKTCSLVNEGSGPPEVAREDIDLIVGDDTGGGSVTVVADGARHESGKSSGAGVTAGLPRIAAQTPAAVGALESGWGDSGGKTCTVCGVARVAQGGVGGQSEWCDADVGGSMNRYLPLSLSLSLSPPSLSRANNLPSCTHKCIALLLEIR